jgi:hypothetical protein
MSTITISRNCDLGQNYSWNSDKKEDAKVKRWYQARAREVAPQYGATLKKVKLDIGRYGGVFTTTLSVAKLTPTKVAQLKKAFASKDFGAGKPIKLGSLFYVNIINQKLDERARTATFKCEVGTHLPATAASAAAAVPKVARLLKKHLVYQFTHTSVKNWKVQSVKLVQDKRYICVVLKELVPNAMKNDAIFFESYMDFDDDGNYPITVDVQPYINNNI